MEGSRYIDASVCWDRFKRELASDMVKLKKDAKGRITRGFRQRIRRLKARLDRCQDVGGKADPRRAEILQKLQAAQTSRRTLRRRHTIAAIAWSSTKSTKHFFRRICNKYGDNTIPPLADPSGSLVCDSRQKAEVMATSWEPIFNGKEVDAEQISTYVRRWAQGWTRTDLSELDERITEEEVNKAINHCSRGKACGPDGLSNDWYRDYQALLAPLLTGLFNTCLAEGKVPWSFREAFISSIPKGGDKSNPRNYRPIALLNTDYKIMTRIMAWRVRKRVEELVHDTQYGFVPGRTIHSTIDIFEAAKVKCLQSGQLGEAQVLQEKGFPPHFCKWVTEIHTDTSVRFLVNGELSRSVPMTSGIRQGCPLAPLLFIIAVDVLYDEIEGSKGCRGIELGEFPSSARITVAGYADDTAIYLRSKQGQQMAIEAVNRFSAVSGLYLNVDKSAAINLGTKERDPYSLLEREVGLHRVGSGLDTPSVMEVFETRYLGHTAGIGDTVKKAWQLAFEAVQVRLSMAELKTNTVSQRAMIASAIIIPKLLYIGRHSWPSEDILVQADCRIRNFVWNSSFSVPSRPPRGWIRRDVAELPITRGGIGIPNIRTELVAMSAMMVGAWATTENKLERIVGEILQHQEGGPVAPIEIRHSDPPIGPGRNAWKTGYLWVQRWMAEGTPTSDHQKATVERIRPNMKKSHGLHMRWTTAGLEVKCSGVLQATMMQVRKSRKKHYGQFVYAARDSIELGTVELWNQAGRQTKWTDYAKLLPRAQGKRLRDFCVVTSDTGEVLYFAPAMALDTDTGYRARLFQEVCLCLLASYPELAEFPKLEALLHVHHGLDDPHHIFEVEDVLPRVIKHTWGSSGNTIELGARGVRLPQRIANLLEVEAKTVWVVPHPWLTQLKPLWTGNRRWRQSRRKYKSLINAGRDKRAGIAKAELDKKWRNKHPGLAASLKRVEWKRVYNIEGITPYQAQNLHRLKLGRLRLWAGQRKNFKCLNESCQRSSAEGTAHLIWGCPDAQELWKALGDGWGRSGSTGGEAEMQADTFRNELFALQLKHIPEWLIRWVDEEEGQDWDTLEAVVGDMWALGCVVTITAIWRFNIQRMYPGAGAVTTIKQHTIGLKKQVAEAFERYRLRCFPLTTCSFGKLSIVDRILARWNTAMETAAPTGSVEVTWVGFFDGGSRGNPGPGGSGSVVVEVNKVDGNPRVIWAAATALGKRDTTNNLAELMGLHRLLQKAYERKWTDIHVIGDSALILEWMEKRTVPKAKKLQFWYREARKLADLCRVADWVHHYRKRNKMADWLANLAMDAKASRVWTEGDDSDFHGLCGGVSRFLSSDMGDWTLRQESGGDASE